MEILKVLVLLEGLNAVSGYVYDPDYLVPPKCPPCDAKSCPQLTFCAGKEVKDHCGCCSRCTSGLFQPHADVSSENEKPTTLPALKTEVVTENPCSKRQCPKFKVCMINVQGLPICTCPSLFVCKRTGKKDKETIKDTQLCGSDGITYESRCHLRIANCNSNRRIKRRHAGVCTASDLEEIRADKLKPISPNEIDFSNDRLGNITGKKKRQRQEKKGKKKNKNRKKERKERNKKKGKKRQKRMKRRNLAFQQVYPPSYEELIGKYTKWSSNQVRKSRI